jgi:monovalent cation:H+ antiporter-2, CPA2 family
MLASQLAEIGIMLPMSAVGLHFSLEDLMVGQGDRAAQRHASASRRDVARHDAGVGAGLAVRRGPCFGLVLAVASTAVLIRALQSAPPAFGASPSAG